MSVRIGSVPSFVAVAVVMASGGPAPAVAQPVSGDPPARVGRIATISGTVSYHLADADRWDPAALNLPVSSGSAFWTEPGAHAEIEISRDKVVLDQSTEFDMGQLDDHALAATEPQGAAYIHLRTPGTRDTYTVRTPRATVTLDPTGRYEVVAGDTENPTTVTVVEGMARLAGTNIDLRVGPNQTAKIVGDGSATPYQGSIGPAVRDQFLTASLASEQAPAPTGRAVAPAVVSAMTGGADLDRYGEWSQAAEYGAVWYPKADPDFVPYRHGRWNYVQPWGWTWVDEAPWGFAPSHYGRWVEVDHRWGWIPEQQRREARGGFDIPVYAPAVVSFIGGFAAGAVAANSVSWVPLGPREPYYPPYRVSNTYVRNVNVSHVTNLTTVVNTYNTYNISRGGADVRLGPGAGPGAGGPGRPGASRQMLMNAAAATVMPEAAMTGSRPVAAVAHPVSAEAFRGAAPIIARPPVTPTMATAGITPAVARRFNLPATQPGAIPAAASPGPAMAARPLGRQGVALRPPGTSAPAAATPAGGGEQPQNRPGAPSSAGPAGQAGEPPGRPGAANGTPAPTAGSPPAVTPDNRPGTPGPALKQPDNATGRPPARPEGATGNGISGAAPPPGPPPPVTPMPGTPPQARTPASPHPQPPVATQAVPHPPSSPTAAPAPSHLPSPPAATQAPPHPQPPPHPQSPQTPRPQQPASAPHPQPSPATPAPHPQPPPRPQPPAAPAPHPGPPPPPAAQPHPPQPQPQGKAHDQKEGH